MIKLKNVNDIATENYAIDFKTIFTILSAQLKQDFVEIS